MITYLLGEGILNWDRMERVSDRYGYVHLTTTPMDEERVTLARYAGTGQLFARILATRQSSHIGDFARGIFPQTPAVGEDILLGYGVLDYQDTKVGLLPEDRRETDWLDPHGLYRCHEQTVALMFVLDSI